MKKIIFGVVSILTVHLQAAESTILVGELTTKSAAIIAIQQACQTSTVSQATTFKQAVQSAIHTANILRNPGGYIALEVVQGGLKMTDPILQKYFGFQLAGEAGKLKQLADELKNRIKKMWLLPMRYENMQLQTLESLLNEQATKELALIKHGTLQKALAAMKRLRGERQMNEVCIQCDKIESNITIEHIIAGQTILENRLDYQESQLSLQEIELRKVQKEVRITFGSEIAHFIEEEIPSYQELMPRYFKYGFHDAVTRFENRIKIYDEMVTANKVDYFSKSYHLSEAATALLRKIGNEALYTMCYGTKLQHVIHQECIDIIERTVVLPQTSPLYVYQEAIVECTSAACEYNQAGLIHKATIVTDACWSLLDYGQAVIEGTVSGVMSAVTDMIEHPVQTAVCAVAGEYVLAYQLSKVLYSVADIGIAYLIDPEKGTNQWNQYIAPVANVIYSITNHEVSTRDIIKGATQFAVEWKTQAKLLNGLNKLYTTAKTQAIDYAKQYPSVSPEQYLTTPEGFILKASQNPIDPKVTKENLVQAMSSEQKIKGQQGAMKGIASEIETAVTTRELNRISQLSNIETVESAVNQIKNITLVEKEILKLSTKFNNTKKGFAEFANKYIKIPYDHILTPDIKILKKDGKVEFGGFHHDLGGVIEKRGLIKFANTIKKGHGFYQADVAFHGIVKPEKTFFPQHWTREKVIGKILEAYDNFMVSGTKPTLNKNGKYVLIGKISEGYDIKIHITKAGEVTSAYPDFK